MEIAGGARRALSASAAAMDFVRRFSSGNRRPDLKRVNPKVPVVEARAIARGISQILKDNGPLTVAATWNHAKDAGISGLNSKAHMKILLKWMRGRKMLRLFCAHEGKHKKFLHSVEQETRRRPQPATAETMS